MGAMQFIGIKGSVDNILGLDTIAHLQGSSAVIPQQVRAVFAAKRGPAGQQLRQVVFMSDWCSLVSFPI